MGRHSAPDDTDQEVTDAVSTVPGTATAVNLGRHARTEDDAHTQRIAVVDAPPAIDEHPTDEHPTDVMAPIDAPVAALLEAPPDIVEPDTAPVPLPGTTGGKPDKKAEKAAAKAAQKAAKRAAKDAAKSTKSAAKADRKSTKPGKPEAGTRADLRLLRQNSAVRAQAIGAVVVSFLLYTVVMVVLGRAASYLLWLWIPIVASGVLVGTVLDLAHRRVAKSAEREPSR